MRVGIVGFSQSGKSTLFEALTGVKHDPSAVMKGQIGVAKVTDPRLDFLTEMYHPKKHTPATIEFIDTPGLIRGEKADNPQRLATLRNAEGLLVILDDFRGTEPPAEQLRVFREELLFADLQVVTNRIEKLQESIKKPKPHDERDHEQEELRTMQAIADRLESGEPIEELVKTEAAERMVRGFQLFLLKPEMVAVNRSEDRVDEPVGPETLRLNPQALAVAAKLELDLAELEGEEREMFMQEMGVSELAHDRVIRMAYDAVGLISFFTVGEDECKAWTIRRGTTAVEAAGRIHTDIARGFIRAEVFAYDDLERLGSVKEIRGHGLQRLEGKDYIVADGDVINVRFNV